MKNITSYSVPKLPRVPLSGCDTTPNVLWCEVALIIIICIQLFTIVMLCKNRRKENLIVSRANKNDRSIIENSPDRKTKLHEKRDETQEKA